MRRKAAYKKLATDPVLEFEYFLAAELGKTVGQMREELDNEEFLYWNVYYARKAQKQEIEMKKARRR